MVVQRVLIIEDERSAREALESLLIEEGYNVRSAPTGLAGLASYRDFNPDAVICDYYLPDVNGLHVLRAIRGADNSDVRFIIVTAGMSGDAVERELRSEADAFLGKPIDLNQLTHALRAHGASPRGGDFLNAFS
jgi:DNA-binding response OmpR family regulator